MSNGSVYLRECDAMRHFSTSTISKVELGIDFIRRQ